MAAGIQHNYDFSKEKLKQRANFIHFCDEAPFMQDAPEPARLPQLVEYWTRIPGLCANFSLTIGLEWPFISHR